MVALLKHLGWLIGNGSLVLATWGMVAATFFLYRDSKKKGAEQREKWQREYEEARIREKRELLNNLIEQFNSPPLLITRAELAYQIAGQPQKSIDGTEHAPVSPRFRFPNNHPEQAWEIATFFERLARQWQCGLLDIDAIDFAFGDYLRVYAKEFKNLLKSDLFATRYGAINKLVEKLDSICAHPSDAPGFDAFSAGHDLARQTFWYSEYKLFRLFPGKLPPLPSKGNGYD